MRIVVIGAAGPYRTETAIAHAIRSMGHACRQVDALWWTKTFGRFGQALARRRVDSFEPDFVLVTVPAFALGQDLLTAVFRGRRSAAWFFDAMDPPDPRVISLGRMADTLFITVPGQVEAYRAAGAGTVLYLPQGMDPWLDRPPPQVRSKFQCEVAFVGSGQYPARHDVLRRVASVSDLHIHGPNWNPSITDLPVRHGAVRGRAFAEVTGGAAISLGANAHPAWSRTHGGSSNRMWKVMGCGGFFLGDYVEGIEQLATGGEHCAWYKSPDEAADLVRYYLDRPELRRGIAAEGRGHALAHHTYAHRLALLFEGLGYSAP